MANTRKPKGAEMTTRQLSDAAIREMRGRYAVDLDARRMWFRASTDKLCPDGKVILPGAWKRGMKQYMKNPVFLDSHHYDSVVDRVLGKTVAWEIDDGGLLLQIEFAQTARGLAAWYLYSEGYANAGSVGWDTLKSARKTDEASGTEYEEITDAQLLEFSGCPVGADSEALSKHANPLVETATRVLAGADDARDAEDAEREGPEPRDEQPSESEMFCTSLLSEMRELRATVAALLVRLDMEHRAPAPVPEPTPEEDEITARLRKVAACVTLTDEQIKERLIAGLKTE